MREQLTARRKSSGFTLESLAEFLGVARNTVWRWENNLATPQPEHRPGLCTALNLTHEQLDTLLTPQPARAHAHAHDAEHPAVHPRPTPHADLNETALFDEPNAPGPATANEAGRLGGLADDALGLSSWLESTNVGETVLESLDETARRMAEDHSRVPPRRLVVEVLRVQRRITGLLRGGRQRMAQTRELHRLNAELLAHACILIGDLKDDLTATTYARTAELSAAEAGASPAAALSAHAKTLRWRSEFTRSAELAHRGWECSPDSPLRTLLACQEANAAALAGDTARARRALSRAEECAAGHLGRDSGVSPWSCTRPRRAGYALSVALHTRDPEAALRAAALADEGWAAGEPYVYATWAQVRFGAAIAYVMLGDLERATAEMEPVLALPPEYRLSTITAYLVHMDKRLNDPRFKGSGDAAAIREQIREFNVAALPSPRRSLESSAHPDARSLEPPDDAAAGDGPGLLARPPRR